MLPTLCFIVLFMSPWIYRLAKKGWLPVTEHMKKRVEVAKERERKEEDKQRQQKQKKGQQHLLQLLLMLQSVQVRRH